MQEGFPTSSPTVGASCLSYGHLFSGQEYVSGPLWDLQLLETFTSPHFDNEDF